MVVGISAALLMGCQRKTTENKQPTPAGQQAVKAPAQAKPAAPVEPITVPEISPPTAGEGGRVVHLIYSSNVDGEVEPCG